MFTAAIERFGKMVFQFRTDQYGEKKLAICVPHIDKESKLQYLVIRTYQKDEIKAIIDLFDNVLFVDMHFLPDYDCRA